MRAPFPSAALAAALCMLALAGCGTSTTSAGFSGEKHAVAQAVANLQSASQSGEYSKICTEYVAAAVISRLGGKKGCEEAFKHQLALVDNLEVTIESVSIASDGRSASASVRSTHSGKIRTERVELVKEGRDWRVSAP